MTKQAPEKAGSTSKKTTFSGRSPLINRITPFVSYSCQTKQKGINRDDHLII
jgi:hypothetical protein